MVPIALSYIGNIVVLYLLVPVIKTGHELMSL